MFNYPSSVYHQAVIVLDSSVGAPHAPRTTAPESGPTVDYDYYAAPPYQPFMTGVLGTGIGSEGFIARTTLSSVPVLWDSELSQDYQELGEALSELTELGPEDEWQIEGPVFAAACFIASELVSESFPAPKVFNHGPKSVVFNWSANEDNLYLTISAERVSALISSPRRIVRRVEFSLGQMMDPSDALLSIRAAYLNEPVKRLTSGTISSPPDLVFWGAYAPS